MTLALAAEILLRRRAPTGNHGGAPPGR